MEQAALRESATPRHLAFLQWLMTRKWRWLRRISAGFRARTAVCPIVYCPVGSLSRPSHSIIFGHVFRLRSISIVTCKPYCCFCYFLRMRFVPQCLGSTTVLVSMSPLTVPDDSGNMPTSSYEFSPCDGRRGCALPRTTLRIRCSTTVLNQEDLPSPWTSDTLKGAWMMICRLSLDRGLWVKGSC